MTPKEKAEKLFDKFYSWANAGNNPNSDEYHVHAAKQCALIAVKEKIDTTNTLSNFIGFDIDNEIDYLNLVKQELEKL